MKNPRHLVMLTAVWSALVGCQPAVTSSDIEQTSEGKPCGPAGLIDDGEDGDNRVLVRGGRGGYAYTFTEDRGTVITPEAGARGGTFQMTADGAHGSKFAARMHGHVGKAEVAFAGMAFNLTDPKDAYDASAYQGISFLARRARSTAQAVRFAVADVNTDPDGGVCGACYNHFGMDLELTDTWQKFTIPFSRMAQESGWGSPRPDSIDKQHLYAISFEVTAKGQPFDVWVDDIAFAGCQ